MVSKFSLYTKFGDFTKCDIAAPTANADAADVAAHSLFELGESFRDFKTPATTCCVSDSSCAASRLDACVCCA